MLSLYLSFSLSHSVCFSFSLSLSLYLTLSVFFYPSVCPSVCLSSLSSLFLNLSYSLLFHSLCLPLSLAFHALDSKILSWWDYGYQMSAMANRTVLVDNNTWNNTHIATVGTYSTYTRYPSESFMDIKIFPFFSFLTVCGIRLVFYCT